MQPFILCVILAVGFMHTMRFAQTRGLNMAWVGAVNYLVAAIFCGALWVLQPHSPVGWPAPVFGCLIGGAFVCLYFLYVATLNMVGPAVTQCVARLSLLIPVTFSVIVFDRRPLGASQVVATVLVVISLPLLTRANPLRRSVQSRWQAPALACVFLVNGASSALMKAYTFHVPRGGQPALLTFLFAVAAVGLLAAAVRGGGRPRAAELLHGVALGLVNVGACYARVAAIALIAGASFFPAETAAGITLSTLAAAVLWKERFRGRTLMGMALAIVAVVLLCT